MGNKILRDRLHELFDYNPNTGIFIRKIDAARRKKARAGQIAGCPMVKSGYLRIMVDGKSYLAHRLAMIYMGFDIDGKIDHINGVVTDNRIENLRVVTHTENARNAKRHITNKSGVMGVNWCDYRKKWTARIKHDGKNLWLGAFIDFDAAVYARRQAERAYGYHENHGRR